jgi:nitroreductase
MPASDSMDPLEVIITRRSIRKYTEKPVPKPMLHDLIEAAVSAPSAGNEQPWQFIILTKRDILDQIPQFHPHASFVKQAQQAILVCGDLSRETFKGYWMIDCSAATQNLLLAAHAKGLGGCWIGIYPRQERIDRLTELLRLPDHIIPFALVALGFPAEQKEREDRYDDARVHIDTW